MFMNPDFVPPEQRNIHVNPNPEVDAVSYQYTKIDYAKDILATLVLGAGFFVMIWIAFALDVITTGM